MPRRKNSIFDNGERLSDAEDIAWFIVCSAITIELIVIYFIVFQ